MSWCEVNQIHCDLAKECENEEQCIFTNKLSNIEPSKQIIVTCSNKGCIYMDGDGCGIKSIRIDSNGRCTGTCNFE
jgi:hypothetical protein